MNLINRLIRLSTLAVIMMAGLLTTSHAEILLAENGKKDQRGLIPELQIKSGDTDEQLNEKKALESEILITRTENKAIEALQNILKRKVGQVDEPDLLYRLAELYMRRSKSGRFFELQQNSKTSALNSFPIPNVKGAEQIRKAIEIYNKIENQFKKYPDMDSVLFNNAFAHQQIHLFRVAETLYKKLLTEYPKSSLTADGTLALAELLYDQQRFSDALPFFKKLETFPNSRVYTYGMYKLAWTYYNLKDSQSGIQKLLEVVKLNPAGSDSKSSYNLRKEALRDLTNFIGDIIGPEGVYPFFAKITTEEELGQSMLDTAQLYDSHSRYKEIPVFINEFNRKHPQSPFLVRTHLVLVNSYEVLKQREKVLDNLRAASEHCHQASPWRTQQTPENLEASCQKKFREESLDISRKWWEIWLKNKSHKEFSSLTERALRLILDNDDAEKPDTKTRYALAELLFQNQKYEESSQQYKQVAEKTTDPIIAHDAAYAAIFAIDKELERVVDPSDPKKSSLEKSSLAPYRKSLVLRYIEKQPQGEFILPVQFKLALLLYEEGQFDESQKVLEALALQSKNLALKTKAEDLILDIYNLKKDFSGLRLKTKEFLAKAPLGERKSNLNKIAEEAQYSEAQSLSTKGDKVKAAESLIQFTQEYPASKMKSEALWQALSLYYSEGKIEEASELSLEFFRKHPTDKRSLDALKEATNSKIELGQLSVAAELLEKLASLDLKSAEDHLLKAAQFLWLEGRKKEARKIYAQLLTQSPQGDAGREKRSKYQDLLISTFTPEEKTESDYQKFVQTLVDQGIEPYATESLVLRAEKLFETNRRSEAFELARKTISRNTGAASKSRAALVQAKILEEEFRAQSVKSNREDRLALVISLKTEKMEKALTSYLSVMRITNEIGTQIQALQGIDRIYSNYLENLGELRSPASIDEAEMKAIKSEVAKILEPIKEKRIENKKEIAKLLQQSPKAQSSIWETLPGSETAKPQIQYPNIESLSLFVPENWFSEKLQWQELKVANPTCPNAKKTKKEEPVLNLINAASQCALSLSGKPSSREYLVNLQAHTQSLLAEAKSRSLGLFYLSLLSEFQRLPEKSLWAAEKAILTLKEPNQGQDPLWFQKLRARVKVLGWEGVQEELPRILEMKTSSPQIEALKSYQHFKSSQYDKTVEILSRLNRDDLYNSRAVLVLSESLCQKGEIDQGISVIKTSKAKNSVEAWIQLGRIYESFKPDLERAREAYSSAQKLSSDEDQKQWLVRKLEYLKSLGQS